MKVLVLSNSFPRNNNKNICKYELDQLVALKELGCEIEVLTALPYIPGFVYKFAPNKIKKKIKNLIDVPEKYVIDGIEVVTIRSIMGLCGKIFYKYSGIVRFIFKNILPKQYIKLGKAFSPDIIYGVGPLWEGQVAKKLSALLGCPYVMIEHSLSIMKFASGDKKLREMYFDVVKHSSSTIFVSSAQERFFLRNIGNLSNTEVILNGFVGSKYSIKKIEENRALKMVSVGFLEERKGHEFLINSLKKVRDKGLDFSLTIIGDGGKREHYLELIKKYNLEDRVTFTGRLPHEEVIECMLDSDVFVLVSYDEPFGIVYLEAMSCGLPIIGSRGEGVEDVIIDGENGLLVSYGDEDELVRGIELLINNPEKRNELGENGKNTALNLTWENNANNTIDLFNKAFIK